SAEREIRRKFRRMGVRMASINRRQAFRPEGAHLIPNPNGSAPGFWLEADGLLLFALPGPPRELKPMFERFVMPILRRRAPRSSITLWEARSIGLPEGDVDELVHRIVGPRAAYGLTATGGFVTITLKTEG